MSEFASRRFVPLLFAIVAVEVGVRVAYVALAKAGPCTITRPNSRPEKSPSQCAVGDQVFYNSEADFVANGHGFNEPFWYITHPGEKPPPAADHPPLTVFVLTPVSWLADHPPFSSVIHEPVHDHVREHRYTMVLLGTLLVGMVGVLGRRVGGATVGLLAAAIVALSPNVWVNDGLVMSETITGLTVVGALLCAFALRDRPTRGRAAALGALCGLAALARAELILFVPLLAIVVACTLAEPWSERLALAGVATIVSLAVIAPWVGFNEARFHDRTFISTNDGIALLGSNCGPAYHGPTTGLTVIAGPRNCLDDPVPPGDQSEVATVYRRTAIDYMKAHEGRAAIVVLARVGRTWGLYRPGDMINFNVGEGREKWVTRLGMVVYYPTLIAAIAGAVVLWRRRRRHALWVLVVPVIVVTIGVAATYGQTRFRAAAEPSLALLAAVAISSLLRPRAGYSSSQPAKPPRETATAREGV